MYKKIAKIIILSLLFNHKGLSQFNTVSQFSVIKKGNEQLFAETKTDSLNATIQQDNNVTTQPDSMAEISVNIHFPLDRLVITSGFGERFHPVEKKTMFHAGIDLKASYEPFYCFADGVVARTGFDERSGNYVVINHGKLETVYCHLSKIWVKQGDSVNSGQILGITGNTGETTAPHLHFEMRWNGKAIDPKIMIKLVVKKQLN